MTTPEDSNQTARPCVEMIQENASPLAILFWFYKDPAVCENRLQLLRRYNPSLKIYGLFGGNVDQANEFEHWLAPYLDDFYVFQENRSSSWKWYHGDRMIAKWFADRGHRLAWGRIFIAQWDMLVCGNIERQLAECPTDALILSGLRPLSEVDSWWSHVQPETSDRNEYDRFMGFVQSEYGYQDRPLCCEFIVTVLPRAFLQRYADIPNAELGFLEYKIPIYAQIFGIPVCGPSKYQPWWGDDPSTAGLSPFKRTLNAECQAVPLRYILAHLVIPNGRRIFHPVFELYPLRLIARIRKLFGEIYHEEFKKRWWRMQKRFLKG